MAWHPFKPRYEYSVDEVILVLTRDLESGRVEDVKGKFPLLELFEEHRGKRTVFTPFGGAWGMSPYNPNVWKTLEGSDLVPGYRRPRARKAFSKAIRLEVSRKTDGHCYSCGHKLTGLSFDICHIIPFSGGGSDQIENLLPGCRVCNRVRQNFTPHQIQRILSIGSVLVREVDRESKLGKDVFSFLKSEDRRRSMNRKHKDFGLLVYERCYEPNQALQPTPMLVTPRADARVAPSTGVADL